MTTLQSSPHAARKANGVFYTPLPVAQYVVRQVFDKCRAKDKESRPRVLDFACGDGVFLQAAFDRLLELHGLAEAPHSNHEERLRLLDDCVYGVDLDSSALKLASATLSGMAGHDRESMIGKNLSSGNALTMEWEKDFANVMQSGGFDVIVGNPPYVNIRHLTKHHGEEFKRELSERYRCAHRAYDVYVLFIELAHRLLKPGGVCGLIVPNKVATLEYARECRELMLQETEICRIDDISTTQIFPTAAVYPYIVIWKKNPPASTHRIAVSHCQTIDQLHENSPIIHVKQSSLSAKTGLTIHGTLDVESRVATETLSQHASLHSGTTGFCAQQIAAELKDREASSDQHFPFIVSRNIDRYVVHPGNVRFMRRQFRQPFLDRASSCLSAAKRELFTGPKIVLAGMSKYLEAAYDPGGLALGVQIYAVARWKSDPYYLLGLLNSKLLSHIFRLRYQAKRMSGGYFAINKGQLAQLPVRLVDSQDDESRCAKEEIIQCVQSIIALTTSRRVVAKTELLRMDEKIDQRVYQLYGLTADERIQIKRAFCEGSSRALTSKNTLRAA